MNKLEQSSFWKNKTQKDFRIPLEYYQNDSGFTWEERYNHAKEEGNERYSGEYSV